MHSESSSYNSPIHFSVHFWIYYFILMSLWFTVKFILPRLRALLNSFQRFELSRSSQFLQVFGCENRWAFCDGECCQWNYQSSHVPLIWSNVWFLCGYCFHLVMHLHWFLKYLWVTVTIHTCSSISKFQLYLHCTL